MYPLHYAQLYLEMPLMPMHPTAMALIGKFKLSPKGHQYALTVTDILTNYTWCILLFMKGADEVMHTYSVNVYSSLVFHTLLFQIVVPNSRISLSTQVASTLGIKQVFSSPYYPQDNGYTENVYLPEDMQMEACLL